MAETAKILSPQKIVLLPDKNAGCPMADMIDAKGLMSLQEKHHDAITVCDVNTSAAVKANCDYCCTSANAIKIVQNILLNHKNKEIIFIPDKYLAQYVSAQVKHDFIIWEGYCPTHVKILPENIIQAKRLHPKAKVIVHPECRPTVTALADVVASTEGMSKYIRKRRKRNSLSARKSV